jgi:D-2-hydroxyacid dehydrogenase (NADP+)
MPDPTPPATIPAGTSPDGTGRVLFCTDTFLEHHGARLRRAAPGIETVLLDATDDVPDGIERVTIAFMSRDTWPDRAGPFLAGLRAAPDLDWFHVMSSGVDGPIFDDLAARGVRVTRSAGASANAMAETVFMFLHALSRDLRAVSETHATRRFEWHRWPELENRRIAVLGYGPVGQRVVQLALAYEMRPTVVRRRVRGDEPCPARTLDDLVDVVAEHDVIVVALPATDDTRNIVSREVIANMTADTLFVNVARGALVDQRALTDALAAGRLAGAGLDVFEVEPLPSTDPLWDLPNVLITPHNSGASRGSPQKVVDLFFANLDLYLAGQTMLYEVPL